VKLKVSERRASCCWCTHQKRHQVLEGHSHADQVQACQVMMIPCWLLELLLQLVILLATRTILDSCLLPAMFFSLLQACPLSAPMDCLASQHTPQRQGRGVDQHIARTTCTSCACSFSPMAAVAHWPS
jgi:hypothetical protein